MVNHRWMHLFSFGGHHSGTVAHWTEGGIRCLRDTACVLVVSIFGLSALACTGERVVHGNNMLTWICRSRTTTFTFDADMSAWNVLQWLCSECWTAHAKVRHISFALSQTEPCLGAAKHDEPRARANTLTRARMHARPLLTCWWPCFAASGILRIYVGPHPRAYTSSL